MLLQITLLHSRCGTLGCRKYGTRENMVVKYFVSEQNLLKDIECLKERQGHLWMIFGVMNCLVFSVAPKIGSNR